MKVTSTTFSYSTKNVSLESFWAGFRAYLKYFPTNVAAGTCSYFFILPSGNDFTFLMQPFFAPNMTKVETKELISPWMNDLSELGVNVNPEYKEFSSFWDAWNASFPLEAIMTLAPHKLGQRHHTQRHLRRNQVQCRRRSDHDSFQPGAHVGRRRKARHGRQPSVARDASPHDL
jgi:hypothetical protein